MKVNYAIAMVRLRQAQEARSGNPSFAGGLQKALDLLHQDTEYETLIRSIETSRITRPFNSSDSLVPGADYENSTNAFNAGIDEALRILADVASTGSRYSEIRRNIL